MQLFLCRRPWFYNAFDFMLSYFQSCTHFLRILCLEPPGLRTSVSRLGRGVPVGAGLGSAVAQRRTWVVSTHIDHTQTSHITEQWHRDKRERWGERGCFAKLQALNTQWVAERVRWYCSSRKMSCSEREWVCGCTVRYVCERVWY